MDQVGAQHTAGIKYSPATQRCRATMTKAGLKDPVAEDAGTAGPLYGVACVNTTLLEAAMARIPTLSRAALATGLARVGSIDVSFPAGPSTFNDVNDPTGGQFWRTLAFNFPCNCWKVSRVSWQKQFT
jgi:hypothetical protein